MLKHSASSAVAEGVALLQGGSMAVTHGRHGKPRPALFVLSADETTLSWESRSRVASAVRRLTAREPSTSVRIADVQALRIGSASLCLEDAATMGDPALSLCLVLGAGAAKPATEERPTLDLSFEDDETFGLWVAALRALVARAQTDAATAASAPSAKVDAPPCQDEGAAVDPLRALEQLAALELSSRSTFAKSMRPEADEVHGGRNF